MVDIRSNFLVIICRTVLKPCVKCGNIIRETDEQCSWQVVNLKGVNVAVSNKCNGVWTRYLKKNEPRSQKAGAEGVTNGFRTHDPQNHNLML